MSNLKAFITALLFCCLAAAAAAAEKPERLINAPISIYADYMKYEIKTGIST